MRIDDNCNVTESSDHEEFDEEPDPIWVWLSAGNEEHDPLI